MTLQLVDSVNCVHYTTVFHPHYALRGRSGGRLMRNNDDGKTAPMQSLQQVYDLQAGLRIQGPGWLIGKYQVGPSNHLCVPKTSSVLIG
jgi:hypothetical protein